MMIVENAFEIGQTVYLLTDEDQRARLVTSIKIIPGGLTYELSCGPEASWHYDFEMSQEKITV